MHRRENCLFDFAQVEDARVEITCRSNAVQKEAGMDDQDAETGSGCYATLHVALSVTDHRLARHTLPQDVAALANKDHPHYHPYYTLELHALNHSKITYKGFDGVGYDVCCDFLNATSGACEWISDGAAGHEQRRRRVVTCALTSPTTPVGTHMFGSVRKPLHKLVEGAWEFKWTLRRGPETVGRLTVPFHVTPAHIASATESDEQAPPPAEGSECCGTSTSAAIVTVKSTDDTQDDHGVDM
jgi:hypothetical protein